MPTNAFEIASDLVYDIAREVVRHRDGRLETLNELLIEVGRELQLISGDTLCAEQLELAASLAAVKAPVPADQAQSQAVEAEIPF
jgi:hypothetical protein